MKFSINDFFSKCDEIHTKLRIWSHLLKKSLMENFIFCAVPAHNIFACPNRDYSYYSLFTIFLVMYMKLEFEFGILFLIKVLSQRCHQLDHVAFSKKVLWSANCIMSIYQIRLIFIGFVEIDI